MIKEYIAKIAKNHSQARADWLEGHIKANMSPVTWWLLEHTPQPISKWLAHRTQVNIIVNTNPWGERITIKKGEETIVSKDFPYKEEDSDEVTA